MVLLLHGFTGSRDELTIPSTGEGVFARAAGQLAEAGYASLRIDFRGSGDSTADLSFADTTFEGQVTDALAALDYLAGLDRVDGGDIYLIGWSQGGLVASAAAGRGNRPDATALWNAVADPKATYGAIFGDDLMARGMAAGADEAVPVTLPWAEITLKGPFFHGVATFDPLAEIADYAGPLLVAQGQNDTLVAPASADAFIAMHNGPEAMWMAEMDHVFNVFQTTETLDALLQVTVAFFRMHDD